jgi:hypothetical protein
MPGDSSRGQEYSIFSISALSLKDWSKLTTHGRSLLPWKFTNRTDRIFRKPHEPNPAALEQGTHDAPTLTWVFQIWERNDKRREHLWMESQASSLCVSLAHKSGDGSRNFTGADFDPIAVVREFGYSELEARFLCVVAQYSGYFTRRQFLAFTGKTKGWAVHNFTEKLLARGHATVTPLGHGIHPFSSLFPPDIRRTGPVEFANSFHLFGRIHPRTSIDTRFCYGSSSSQLPSDFIGKTGLFHREDGIADNHFAGQSLFRNTLARVQTALLYGPIPDILGITGRSSIWIAKPCFCILRCLRKGP